MNAVTKKLKSKAGISLAIALVFFLLCAMVGTVVLSAASASAGSTARERQLYRETAALTSAAQLLSRDIRAMHFTGTYTRTETVTTTITGTEENPSTTVETSYENKPGTCKLDGSKFFKGPNQDGNGGNLTLNELFFSKQGLLGSNTLADAVALPTQTIIFNAVPDQHIPEVKGTLTVGEDYTITVELICGKNSLTMTFSPQTSSQTLIGNPKIETSEDETVTKKITETTYSTTISWKQPVMQEGGASNG